MDILTDTTETAAVVAVVAVVVIVLLALSIRLIRPYEVGVTARFGAFGRVLRPGFHLVTPMTRVRLVDMRVRSVSLPSWAVRTPTGLTMVACVISFQVTDPPKSVFQVANLEGELELRARTVVTALLEGADGPLPGAPDTTLAARARDRLQAEVAPFGVEVKQVFLQQPPGRAR